MLKLSKFLKPFIFLIILIVGLLFVQALSNLSLPEYMSNIVNNGIQQYGIENAVPKVIRKSEFDRLTIFLEQKELDEIRKVYTLLDKDNLSSDEYQEYVTDYPLLKEEVIYKLDTNDKDIIEDINDTMGKAILIVSTIEKKGLSELGSQMDMNKKQTVPSNVDPFVIISSMPEEQFAVIKSKFEEQFKGIPDSMITQSATLYIKDEYQKIGIDVGQYQKNYIIISGLKMIGIALIGMIAAVIVGFLAAKVSAGLGRNIRKALFTKVTNFSNVELDKFGISSLITRTTNDIQQMQMLMVMLLRIVFYAPILGIGGVIKVLGTDTSMGWIVALALALILIVVIVLFVIAVPKFKLVQKFIDKLNLVTRERLNGMLVIRAFNTQKYEEKKFDKANIDLTKLNLFIARIMSSMMPFMMLIMNGVTILIVWVGSHQVDSGAIQVGDMMAFIQYTMQIIMAFLMITMISIMLPRASVSASRVAEVLETRLSITDPKKGKKFNNDKKGYVEFKNVSFKYPDADDCVIKNVSFAAKPGETTAFIGSTGSGKSTVVNLIPRFYDVTEGSILVDGVDIKDVSQYELHEKIGYVPQKGILFSGNIEDNLKYGDEKATNQELMKAIEIAQASDFIFSKDAGLNMEVAQGGTNVSGGQKQRLSIARAIVKKPEIYIFDDSFSALDFKTDAALRSALKKETKNSTVLIVAQRISTVMNANQIIVLDKGEVVGIGTHKELMKKCSVYQEIALSQLSKEELANE